MNRKIGAAVLTGALAAAAFASTAQAQCGTGPMIIFNTASFAYEKPSPVGSPYISPAGNRLVVVGLVQKFCAPFLDLNATSPDTEFTFVLDTLVSPGTTITFNGPTTIYETIYGSGNIRVFRNTPRNAPQSAAAMPGNPPNAAVPANYLDGEMILSGTLANFTVDVTKTGLIVNGSYRGDLTFTGGTLYSRVQNTGATLLQGNWCVTGCLPSSGGYSAQLDGKIDTPATPAHSSTWGLIKMLYR